MLIKVEKNSNIVNDDITNVKIKCRTDHELEKSNSKVHLTKSPCEKGYTVILTDEKDSKILTSTTYSNGHAQEKATLCVLSMRHKQ